MNLTDAIINQFRAKGSIPEDRLLPLLNEAKHNGLKFAILLIHHGWMDRDTAGMVLGDAIGHSYLNLEKTLFEEDTVGLLPYDMAKRYNAIPVYKFGDAVTVATTQPYDSQTIGVLSTLVGHPVDDLVAMAPESVSNHCENALDVERDRRRH